MDTTKLKWAAAALCLTLVGGVTAAAEDTTSTVSSRLQKAGALDGLDIKNATGKDVGEIKGFVVAPEEGRVAFVVIKHESRDNQFLAVPLSALKFRFTQPDSDGIRTIDEVSLAMEPADMEKVPSLPNEDWQKVLTLDLDKRVRQHYKIAGTYSGSLVAGSTVMGADIRSDGEDVGDIENLMIDTQDGRILYAIVGYGGVLGVGEDHRALPWKALGKKQSDGFHLTVTREQMKTGPTYLEKRSRDPEWIKALYDAYDISHEGLPTAAK